VTDKPRRTPEDLTEAFRRRVRLLRSAASGFDAGDEDQGYILAIHLRLLLHDPDVPRPGRPHAPSLLEQLGEKDRLRFPDSVWRPLPPDVPDKPEMRAAIIKPFDGPWMIKLTTGPEGGARLAAPLGGPIDWSMPVHDFSTWWGMRCGNDARGNMFSRRDLVLDVANLDGAHAAPILTEKYVALTRDGSLGIGSVPDGISFRISSPEPPETPPEGNPALVGVRQAAWEVDRTLSSQLLGLLRDAEAA
jgi:hypothetical protein